MFITKWGYKKKAAIFCVVQIYLVFLESNCFIFALTSHVISNLFPLPQNHVIFT